MTRGRIIQLRGASGSGKTTVMRKLMDTMGPCVRVRPKDDPTKRKPTYLAWPKLRVVVIGHYDVSCGGCDTIKSKARPYELARELSDMGVTVIMEGLFISREFLRSQALSADGYDRHDIFMRVPVDQCTANVQARRVAQGREPKPLKQMSDNWRENVRVHGRMLAAGLPNVTLLEGETVDVGEREHCL